MSNLKLTREEFNRMIDHALAEGVYKGGMKALKVRWKRRK